MSDIAQFWPDELLVIARHRVGNEMAHVSIQLFPKDRDDLPRVINSLLSVLQEDIQPTPPGVKNGS